VVTPHELLQLDDAQLLNLCEVHTYKASGPGGQHRNKVSSAVRLVHRSTGISAHGDESRSQHQNKALALKRLRMHLALKLRSPLPQADAQSAGSLPPAVAECIFTARGGPAKGKKRLEVGRKDQRFWLVAAVVLDALEHFEGRLSDAADWLGISTGNLSRLLTSERHLMSTAGQIRQQHGLGALK
jgi:hypothetical protein